MKLKKGLYCPLELKKQEQSFRCELQGQKPLIFSRFQTLILWVLRQKSKNNFVRFLVQMRTRKFAFEINWPLVALFIYPRHNLLKAYFTRTYNLCGQNFFLSKLLPFVKACGFLQYTKGQSISKCPFGVFKSPKKTNNVFS